MSSTNTSTLPATCRGLVYTGVSQPLSLETIPVPEAVPGSLIVKILAANLDSSAYKVTNGEIFGLDVPAPSVPGARGVGRVAALGNDTSTFKVGQLVLLDTFIRARDNPEVSFLWGTGVFGGDARAKKLSQEVWAHGMWAEYVRAPLENVYALNEKVLTGNPKDGGLGYTHSELTIIARHIVPYGGLRGINLQPGETVVVAPATGSFSGGAVDIASALGAKVIAVGRSKESLKAITATHPRVHAYELKGDVEEDEAEIRKLGPIDAYIDISPAAANNSTHVRSCIGAVRAYGRVSLMGVISHDIPIPYVLAMLRNLTIRGQYMYEREDVRGLIKLVEAGVLKLGKSGGHEVVDEFKLEDWEAGFKCSAANQGAGKIIVFTP